MFDWFSSSEPDCHSSVSSSGCCSFSSVILVSCVLDSVKLSLSHLGHLVFPNCLKIVQVHSGIGWERKELGFDWWNWRFSPSSPRLLFRCLRAASVQFRLGKYRLSLVLLNRFARNFLQRKYHYMQEIATYFHFHLFFYNCTPKILPHYSIVMYPICKNLGLDVKNLTMTFSIK